jgi:hypothetical protein
MTAPLLLSSITAVALFWPPTARVTVPAVEVAAPVERATISETDAALTEREEKILFRICDQVADNHKARCRARQLQRLGYSYSKSNPTGVYELYDKMDLGKHHLRATLTNRRLVERLQEAAQTRETYRQNPLQSSSDVNPDYVDFIREERLKCMLITRSRPKSLCLDALAQEARGFMKPVPRAPASAE